MPDTPFIRIPDLRPWIGLVPPSAIAPIVVNGKTFWAAMSQILGNVVVPARYVTVTTNYQSVAGDVMFVDTSAGPITVSLPVGPTLGSGVAFIDKAGTWGINNLTVDGGPVPIVGLNEPMIVDIARGAFALAYSNVDWRLMQ